MIDAMRPDWDSYFMKIAFAVSERSTCDRALVGCVLVRDKRILTSGFNGSPSGQPHCDEVGHLLVEGHCVRTIHAETNAIIQAALHGVSTRDSTCYVTHFPCINCTKALINAGIVRLVYHFAYRVDENALDFLDRARMEIVQLDMDPNHNTPTHTM
jgi:dCMP deaminase